MTKAEIIAKHKKGELRAEDAMALIEKLDEPVRRDRTPPRFKVAIKSGWCSVYFDGLRRPCTLPSKLWLELLEPASVERFKSFLEHNKEHFKNK